MKQLYRDQLKTIFTPQSPFRLFLLSVLITGLSYGLHKGMLDNFLAEVVGLGEMERGVTEFFRELPVLATPAICVYSFSKHILLGMKSTFSLKYAVPDRGGAWLVQQRVCRYHPPQKSRIIKA